MTKEEIKELFMQGIDCSQVVAGRFADELESDKATGTIRTTERGTDNVKEEGGTYYHP